MIVAIETGIVKATGVTLRHFVCRFSDAEFRAFAARLDPDKPTPADPMTRALHAEMVTAIGDKSAAAVMREASRRRA